MARNLLQGTPLPSTLGTRRGKAVSWAVEVENQEKISDCNRIEGRSTELGALVRVDTEGSKP